MNSSANKFNVSCVRSCKRRFRSKINWNEWQLRTQLRVNLVSMMIAFFALHFSFLILTTWYQYKSSVEAAVQPSLTDIFETKLSTSSDAITLCYQQQENSDVYTVKSISKIASDILAYPSSFATTPQLLVNHQDL